MKAFAAYFATSSSWVVDVRRVVDSKASWRSVRVYIARKIYCDLVHDFYRELIAPNFSSDDRTSIFCCIITSKREWHNGEVDRRDGRGSHASVRLFRRKKTQLLVSIYINILSLFNGITIYVIWINYGDSIVSKQLNTLWFSHMRTKPCDKVIKFFYNTMGKKRIMITRA